jgi:hypothetical protein
MALISSTTHPRLRGDDGLKNLDSNVAHVLLNSGFLIGD